MTEIELTKAEERAIATLKRLAKRWPPTLWLFSASGSLCVMRKTEDGEHAHFTHEKGSGVDPAYMVDHVEIENDGGDW